MKTKLVDTVVGNGEYIRLRIFDGEFTPDNAYQELLRLEQEQRKADRFFYEERIKYLMNEIRSLRPNKGKNMNEITTIPNMDGDQIAKLMAELHADANPGVTSDGEATQSEGAFVSEDDATVPVATN